MTVHVPKPDLKAAILVLDIGNSRVAIATWHESKLITPIGVDAKDEAGFNEAITAHLDAMPDSKPGAIAISSVNKEVLEIVRPKLENQFDRDALVVGERLALPIEVAVDDPAAVGTDRVCAAAAAYETLETACTIVDFGTAVTVDLVSDDGVLMGGAILPGLELQLRAMHDYTSALPEVTKDFTGEMYGRNTEQAMLVGVHRGLASAVRGLVEGYATTLERWLQVIATGGDVIRMAPYCDFLDTTVSHLVLRGVGIAYDKHLSRATF